MTILVHKMAEGRTVGGQPQADSAEKLEVLRAYKEGLGDPYILHVRKLNGYLKGINVEDICRVCVVKYKCGGVPSSLDCFSKDYFRSMLIGL